jgi:predicted ATPase
MTVFIRKVSLGNYRSIAQCEVELGPVTFLVGANGSGKSNFLDALRLISDSLNRSLDHSLRDRGGLEEVRRRSGGHPTHFSVRVDFELAGSTGFYAFKVGAKRQGTWSISHEECRLGAAFYSVREGTVQRPIDQAMPPAQRDRLYLVNAAGLPAFRPVYDALSQLGFYSVQPNVIRGLQPPDEGRVLHRDGGNLASVVATLDQPERRETKQRILEYLKRVVPGIDDFCARRIGPMETIEFMQAVEGAERPWRFTANNMSDGTLRALAVLVALFQGGDERNVRLVGIEEPETALHPAAARVLRDCILDAGERAQVIVTSHSAELLDDNTVDETMIRAVVAEANRTAIGRVNEATRATLREHLFTAGELLRIHQLEIDPAAREIKRQLRLFEGEDE